MNKKKFKKIITSHTKLKLFLKENRLYLKKRFGQNFLFDKNIILKIINSIPFTKNNIIEIGPGLGNLTLYYYKKPDKTILIEIDKGLVKQLNSLFTHDSNITVIHSDFLKYNLQQCIIPKQKYIILSNLPYSMGSQILIKLLEYYDIIKEIYIMAPEIYAKKFLNAYLKFNSKLSVLLNLFFKIDKLFKVQKNSFFPAPEVGSVFMRLTPEKKINDIKKAKKILTLLFKQKRKKLKKTLEISKNKSKMYEYLNKRVDELPLNDIINIINLF